MNDRITTDLYIRTDDYPERYAALVGEHRLVGWGNYTDLRDSILPRVFGFMVQLATPVVKEFHGDLLTDADHMRTMLDNGLHNDGVEGFEFLYCVRHSGTNLGPTGRLMFESLAYNAALYHLRVYAVGGEWRLDITLLDARPDRA